MSTEPTYYAKSDGRYVREVHIGKDTHNVVFCEGEDVPLSAPKSHWQVIIDRGAALELEAT